MAKYVKLGTMAESFFDASSRLGLAGKDVKELTSKALRSNRVDAALKGGHLIYASEQEFVKGGGKIVSPEDSEEIVFTSKFGDTVEELVNYYKEKYDVKPADIRNFKKLSLDGMAEELAKLESE